MSETEEDNIILVGTKPVMSYVLAVVTQFNQGASEVIIRARGKAVSRAVDTAEILIHKFMSDVKKKSIETSTELVESDAGEIYVSAIQIVLAKGRARRTRKAKTETAESTVPAVSGDQTSSDAE